MLLLAAAPGGRSRPAKASRNSPFDPNTPGITPVGSKTPDPHFRDIICKRAEVGSWLTAANDRASPIRCDCP
jgi:hypothetical protein